VTGKRLTDIDWYNDINYEAVQNLNYLQMCVNETLRIDPSVRLSTSNQVTEFIDLGGVRFRNDHGF
jgi:cytochrome P450